MAHVEKRAAGRWRARWVDPSGKAQQETFDRKSDAERRLDGVRHAMRVGSYVDPAAGRVTVGDWAGYWLPAQAHLKPSTLARYQGILSKHVIPRWGTVPLSRITHADVAAWLGDVQLAPASTRYVHRVFSLMLDLAVRDGRIAANPATGVRLPRAQRSEKTALTHDQVRLLADAAGDHGTLILTLAYTGLRWGEAAALRVGRLDLLKRRLTVAESVTEVGGKLVWGTPKSHAHRQVSTPAFLIDDLAALVAGKAPDDLVFTTGSGSVLRNLNFRRDVFDRAAAAVGLDGITPHVLRHTAASLAISAGASVKSVQGLLGHASATTTLDVYSHWFGDDLDRLADSLDLGAVEARDRPASTVHRLG